MKAYNNKKRFAEKSHEQISILYPFMLIGIISIATPNMILMMDRRMESDLEWLNKKPEPRGFVPEIHFQSTQL